MIERDLVSAYLDGELAADERIAFETKLASDASLREELATIGAVRARLRGAPSPAAPADFVAQLLVAGDEAGDEAGDPVSVHSHASRRWRRLTAAGAAAAAIALAFAVTEADDRAPIEPAIEANGDGHVTNAGLADDPILLLAPAAGSKP